MHRESMVHPRPTLNATAWLVAMAGAATMVNELTVLRYVPGSVRVLGYFTNFVLLAAFVGLGVGMLASRRWPGREWISWIAPISLLGLVVLTELARHVRVLSSGEEVLFLEYQTLGPKVPLQPFLVIAYVAIALSFAPLGYWVGTTLVGDRPLVRYAHNVVGSLAGIAVFAAFSAAGARPWVWMAVAVGTLLAPLARAPVAWRAAGLAAAVAATAILSQSTRDAVWSPYQKISVGPARVHPDLGLVSEWQIPRLTPEARGALATLPESRGFTVRVNDDSYQVPIDLSNGALEAEPALGPLRLQYDLPFLGRPPGRVLVLGAGTGNDVAAALRAGATHVDAVEIDPEILRLGARHPEHPYADARVTSYVADARTFLSRDAGSYDTIVYGLLDSHVLLSSMSNVRLDSYVFTVESFSLARGHLLPGGVLVVSHAVGRPWFVDRMRATLARAFERPPMLVSEKVRNPIGFVYAAGEMVPPGAPVSPSAGLIEDDWPFVYLRARAIPSDYLVAMALIALASLALVRVGAGSRFRGVDLHFFFLGAGFLLLETRGLAVLALLLGTTWGVTSSVFGGVLTMALGATALGAKLCKLEAAERTIRLVYVLLAATLLLQFVVAPADLAGLPIASRIFFGACLVSLPLFASGTIFATSLARAGAADRALASNLTGAIAGGLAEYVSMIVGFRALVILAAVFYALTYVARGRPGLVSTSGTPSGHSSGRVS